MTDGAILYSFRRCPYAIRARMALLVSAEPFAIREVSLKDKPPQLIAVSPKATVPVLITVEGQVIDESIDIMRWALNRYDPDHWLDGDDATLIAQNDGPFKHHLDRYKYADRHASNPITHRDACLDLLAILERRLSQTTNLCGGSTTLTDIAIMPFVRQFANVEADWFQTQNLNATRDWLSRHLDAPLFKRAMVSNRPTLSAHRLDSIMDQQASSSARHSSR
jgi:glutathione S-transferase